MDSLNEQYQQKINHFTGKLQSIQEKLNFISILRLSSFILFVSAIYLCVRDFQYSLLFALLFFLVAFIVLVRIYFTLKDKKALNQKLLFINSNELGMLLGGLNQFDDGKNFLSHESYFDDLDIFGQRSLYHLLNRTTTSHGSLQLAKLLGAPLLQKENIEKQQEAVKILSADPGIRQMLIAHGLLNHEKDGNLSGINRWLKTSGHVHKKQWLLIVRWALPFLNIAAIIFYLQTDNYLPIAAGVIASWIVIGLFSAQINEQHKQIGEKQKILNQYADILKIFSNVNPSSSDLLYQLHAIAGQAHRTIKKLSQLTSFFDQRLNMVVNILLNSLFIYDIHCLIALEKWKEQHKDEFEKYIDCVGNIECLNSLGCFAYNHPGFVYPNINERSLYIEARQLAHPLIPENECVPNDFLIGRENQLHLVTGSNMSGKTTFLRTVGINLLLAECGAPVCAAYFSFAPMGILSSIRVSDSLQEHTSYFMAELKRLQNIIMQLQTDKPSLVLVDEILRGTNSEDKTHGSEQFIRKVLSYHCLSLFATHDLSLSELENELLGKISNYCFESVIQDGQLHFDYTLQKGVAKNKNASFLMQKMGII
jgi:DNA mismatch repair ATPase MutS